MKLEQQLELQAYLDGEVSARAARRVAGWMAQDPDAQALAGELRMTKGVLAGNEPEAVVPESREFYWSKIQRAIETAERQPSGRWRDWIGASLWRKFLLPVSGLALVVVLALGIIKYSAGSNEFYLTEVENLSEYFSSHAFRSHADNVLVVWISAQHHAQSPEDMYPTEEEDDVVVQ